MMRFFSGIRSGDKKKNSASELYKQKMSGKAPREKTVDEKYKDMIEAKTQKMMEDAIMGRKKSSVRIPGTKKGDDAPKELSKNTKNMLKLLAQQKLQNDAKKEKKIARAERWEANAKKRADALTKAIIEAQIEAEKKAAEEAAALAIAAAQAAAETSNW